MPAFSTEIKGLYRTVTHSSLRLALLQMERQRGKGTGCHNLASHTVDKSHSCRHTHIYTGQSTQACIKPHECFHVQKSSDISVRHATPLSLQQHVDITSSQRVSTAIMRREKQRWRRSWKQRRGGRRRSCLLLCFQSLCGENSRKRGFVVEK